MDDEEIWAAIAASDSVDPIEVHAELVKARVAAGRDPHVSYDSLRVRMRELFTDGTKDKR